MSDNLGDYVTSRGSYVIYVEPRMDEDVYVLYKEHTNPSTWEVTRTLVSQHLNLDATYADMEVARRKDFEDSRKRMNIQPMWDKED